METPASMLIAVSELSGPLHFQHRMTGRGSIRSMTASLYARLAKWATRENQSFSDDPVHTMDVKVRSPMTADVC